MNHVGCNTEVLVPFSPDPLPNAMRKKGSGDITFNDLFTSPTFCCKLLVLINCGRRVLLFCKKLDVLQPLKSFGCTLN